MLRFTATIWLLALFLTFTTPVQAQDDIPWGEITAYLWTGQPPEVLRTIETIDLTTVAPETREDLALAGAYLALQLGRYNLARRYMEIAQSQLMPGAGRYLQMTLRQALAYRLDPGSAREQLAQRWLEASAELKDYTPDPGEEGGLTRTYVLGWSFGLWLEQAVESEAVLESAQLPLLEEIQATARRVSLAWAAPTLKAPTLGVYLSYLEAAVETLGRLSVDDPLTTKLSPESDFAELRRMAEAAPPVSAGQPGGFTNRAIIDAFLDRVTTTYQLRELERMNEQAAGRLFDDQESARMRELMISLKGLIAEGGHIGNLMRYYVVGTETALHSQKTGWEEGILKLLESPPKDLASYPWLNARALVVRSTLRRRAGRAKEAQADAADALKIYRKLSEQLDVGGLLRLRREARPAFEALVEANLTNKDSEGAFQAAWTYLALESQASLPGGKDTAFPVQTSAQAAKRLASEQRFLLYFPGDKRLVIFALDAQGLSWSGVEIGRRDLQGGIGSLRRALGVKEGYRRLGGTAWDGVTAASKLIDSMPTGQPKELVLGTPSFLINCPWSYLLSNSPRFGAHPPAYRVSDLSGPIQSPASITTMLALGNPDGSLPAAQQEVESLTTVVPKATVAVGDRATRALLGQFPGGTLHLATHGTIDPRLPSASYLVLAGPDHLLASQVEALKLPGNATDLVVLSACNSGIHALDDTGLRSLAGAFMRTGAKRVLGTLWPVNDEATSVLMLRFYQEMAKGHTPEQALLSAQSALRESSRYSDPNLWAPFTLYAP